jgi:2-polyprenyl-3-methyl-5-hydroxy-6-metoxy-1,4-benzoquinol methylase
VGVSKGGIVLPSLQPSLHDEVTRHYYQTTAGRGHSASKAYYDQVAAGLHRRLHPWLPQHTSARCLDLACGCGEVLYLLEQLDFPHTVGIDLCEEEVEHARCYVHGQVVQADVLSWLQQSESATFDFITALNFLEHLSKDMLFAVLSECARVLRPGGVLIAMVPNAISPLGGLTRHWDITHEWAFTPNNFRQLAPITGFRPKVDFRECGPVPYGIKSSIRYVLWQMIRLGIASWFLIEVADTKGGIYTMDMLVRLHKA